MSKQPFVDQDLCISCGLCVNICPAVFRFNDEGRSEVHDPAGAAESQIQTAVDGCPVQAISWTSLP